MGFGTPEYDATLKSDFKHFKPKPHKNKKNNFKGKLTPKNESPEALDEKDPMVKYPELPENWVKPSMTGSLSYDETVNEISKQLKRTIVSVLNRLILFDYFKIYFTILLACSTFSW